MAEDFRATWNTRSTFRSFPLLATAVVPVNPRPSDLVLPILFRLAAMAMLCAARSGVAKLEMWRRCDECLQRPPTRVYGGRRDALLALKITAVHCPRATPFPGVERPAQRPASCCGSIFVITTRLDLRGTCLEQGNEARLLRKGNSSTRQQRPHRNRPCAFLP